MTNAAASAATLSPVQRLLAVGVIACVMVLELLDMTILNVALPTLQKDFGASPAQLQWMVAGYGTVFALLLVTAGRLGDIFGYKPMLILGMAGFTCASLLCGIVPTPDTLIAARLLQGLAGALMAPQGTSLVQIMFAPHERMKPLAVYGLLGGFATMLGPILGGAIIGADWFGLGWRPVFLINLPIGLATIALAFIALPAGRSSEQPTLDWTGTALSTGALFALLFPLIQGAHLGWPVWSFGLLAVSPALLWWLWRHSAVREASAQSPLVVPSLFGVPGFGIGLAVSLLFGIGSTGFFFILPIVMQSGLGMSATASGLVHLPMALMIAVGIGFLSRRLLPRLGASMIAIGAIIMAAGIGWLALLVARAPFPSSPETFYAPMALAGFGMGLTIGPLPPCTMSDVDVAHAGAGSGLLKTTQQLGGALGVALVGNLFFLLGGLTGRESIISAWLYAMIAVAAMLLLAGALALRFPRTLRIFKAQPEVVTAAT